MITPSRSNKTASIISPAFRPATCRVQPARLEPPRWAASGRGPLTSPGDRWHDRGGLAAGRGCRANGGHRMALWQVLIDGERRLARGPAGHGPQERLGGPPTSAAPLGAPGALAAARPPRAGGPRRAG